MHQDLRGRLRVHLPSAGTVTTHLEKKFLVFLFAVQEMNRFDSALLAEGGSMYK